MTPKCPDCKRDQDDCVCVDPQERIEELERTWLSPETYETLMEERKELLADNARLREAGVALLNDVGAANSMLGAISMRQAIAATSEQSLAAYRNKVIEECAKRAEAYTYMSQNFNALAEELRAMKEQP